ncbi:cytochrome b [Agrobacterium vitis]|uniref:Cytochrome b n=1 Tax=Agrobacterium vitis TaxID=373 RepID=A0AAE4WFH0_AGRVI|nr:cytochrome b/b6 domain-containing protein [Agrobacterium vitis]MCF1498102.1 cytochrome b [Allorhizobium sp. Av2]MCM2440227.1 cytochrome b [Agrobacterium vitis]MUZ58022.1 cytochrome b [Agrobacterium vitis]MVA67568.1 cytochrome b [Agrobacterium vitis]MVA86902.1 cytochrome b [Agrobacterium vitis]
MVSNPVAGYSIAQRMLHWSMALLIFFNLIFSDGIENWNRLTRGGETVTPNDLALANIHAYVGVAILVLCLVRLVLRLVQGAPDAPDAEAPVLKLAANLAHWAFYALFFLMPITGIAKYYFGIDALGELHGGPLKLLLWALIIVHVLAAFVHQFYWKTNVLTRMTRGIS